jgi:capsular polysaccharide transport system permease protein
VSATAGHQGGPGQHVREAGVLHGFAVQGRVIHALLLREMQTRFGRKQLGFLWLLIEPLMLSSCIAALHWVSGHSSVPGVSVFVFYIVGYTPFFAFRAIISRASGAFHSNMTLMYHRQVRLFDIVVARHLLETAAILAVLTLVVIGVVLVTEKLPYSLPALVAGSLMMLLYAHGLGLLAAAVASVSDAAERLIHPLIYLSMPISGAFFTMHSMPTSVRNVMLWNPQVHFHEMVREGMFGDVLISYFDVPYMVTAILVVNLLGMCAMRAVRPRLEF